MTDWLKENRETNMACRFIFPENVDGKPKNQNLNEFGEATAVLRDDGIIWMEVSRKIHHRKSVILILQYFSTKIYSIHPMSIGVEWLVLMDLNSVESITRILMDENIDTFGEMVLEQ